jgi:aryl-alcohol dehydrogenase-like predicted oxidoreductase
MNMNRREFLATTLAGAGAALLGGSGLALAAPAAPNPFEMMPLGKSGLKVTRIGIGTGVRAGMRASNQTRMGAEAFESLVRTAFDRGIRFFDMADMYGSHPYVARALKGIPRDQYVMVSKIWVRSGGIPEQERFDANIIIDRFRKELSTDYIDLVLIHCMVTPNWTDEQKKQMDIMADQKAKGTIRAHGVSCHPLDALRAAAASPWVDSVHARINAFGEAMDGKPEQVAPILKQIHDAGKGVVGMKLIGEGKFRDDEQKKNESIRYVLKLGCVDTMIVGFEKAAEIDDFSARVKTALTA